MAEASVGKVVHFFDKISVAILDLTDDLVVGDHVKFVRRGEELFEQDVESMQVGHEQVESAGKGQSVGIKTPEKAKEGAEVFKVI